MVIHVLSKNLLFSLMILLPGLITGTLWISHFCQLIRAPFDVHIHSLSCKLFALVVWLFASLPLHGLVWWMCLHSQAFWCLPVCSHCSHMDLPNGCDVTCRLSGFDIFLLLFFLIRSRGDLLCCCCHQCPTILIHTRLFVGLFGEGLRFEVVVFVAIIFVSCATAAINTLCYPLPCLIASFFGFRSR